MSIPRTSFAAWYSISEHTVLLVPPKLVYVDCRPEAQVEASWFLALNEKLYGLEPAYPLKKPDSFSAKTLTVAFLFPSFSRIKLVGCVVPVQQSTLLESL